MRFEEALIAMMKGAKIKRSIYETPIAYSSKRNKICFWVDETIGKDGTNYGCEVEFANADRVANDWAVVETEQDGDGDNMDKNEIARDSIQCCMPKQSLCDTCRKVLVCPMMQISMREKCELYEKLPNPLDEYITETHLLNPIKEEKPMESAERIEITFKSGETISYGKGEWDDYAYDGKAVIVKKNSAWIGIYNFDDVFCVELK